jgi:hypothetical protein
LLIDKAFERLLSSVAFNGPGWLSPTFRHSAHPARLCWEREAVRGGPNMNRATPSPSPAQRSYAAKQIVHRHALYVAAATAGWQTPLWAVSSPAVTVLQMKMLGALAEHYDVPFSQASAKPVLASLAGGALSYVISRLPLLMAVKAWLLTIPAIGIPLRFATGPALLAAYTVLLGGAFARHFEAGGDLTNFDVSRFNVEALRALKARV